MFKKLLIVVLAIVAIIVSVAARQGSTFSVERQIDVRAAPGRIFPLVADLHQWPQWSPWEQFDPKLERKFFGAASGPGAIYAWRGTHRSGVAQLDTVDAAARKIGLTLVFTRPTALTSQASFTLAPQGALTRVTWRMQGPLSFRSRLISSFIGMDLLLGSDLDKGLAGIKAAAEK